MDQNFKISISSGYFKNLHTWCEPNELMTATTVNDAEKECSGNPNCYMFSDRGGLENRFAFCEKTSSIYWQQSSSSILYQTSTSGNKP